MGFKMNKIYANVHYLALTSCHQNYTQVTHFNTIVVNEQNRAKHEIRHKKDENCHQSLWAECLGMILNFAFIAYFHSQEVNLC